MTLELFLGCVGLRNPMVFRLVFSEFAQANPQFRTKWLSGVSCVFLLTSGLAYVYRYGKYDIGMFLYIIFMYNIYYVCISFTDIDIYIYILIMCMWDNMYICTKDACIYVYMYIYICIYIYMYICIYIYVFIYILLYIACIYTYVSIYRHTNISYIWVNYNISLAWNFRSFWG